MDLVDENRQLPLEMEQKREGRGRKLLGLFGRNKRKPKPTTSSSSYQVRGAEAADEVDLDGSIISDAILRDRHDRFVTKL